MQVCRHNTHMSTCSLLRRHACILWARARHAVLNLPPLFAVFRWPQFIVAWLHLRRRHKYEYLGETCNRVQKELGNEVRKAFSGKIRLFSFMKRHPKMTPFKWYNVVPHTCKWAAHNQMAAYVVNDTDDSKQNCAVVLKYSVCYKSAAS